MNNPFEAQAKELIGKIMDMVGANKVAIPDDILIDHYNRETETMHNITHVNSVNAFVWNGLLNKMSKTYTVALNKLNVLQLGDIVQALNKIKIQSASKTFQVTEVKSYQVTIVANSLVAAKLPVTRLVKDFKKWDKQLVNEFEIVELDNETPAPSLEEIRKIVKSLYDTYTLNGVINPESDDSTNNQWTKLKNILRK